MQILGFPWAPQLRPLGESQRSVSLANSQVILRPSWAPDCKLALEMLESDHKLDIWRLVERERLFCLILGKNIHQSVISTLSRREHGLGSLNKGQLSVLNLLLWPYIFLSIRCHLSGTLGSVPSGSECGLGSIAQGSTSIREDTVSPKMCCFPLKRPSAV